MNGFRFLWAGALVVLLSRGALSAQPAPAATNSGEGPRIAFQTPIFDFGRAGSGEQIKYTFYFTNAGNEKLVLNAVHPSCGCTAAGEWSREVSPGGTGQIPIQFSTLNFSGPVAKTVTVNSNDRQQPVTTLQIRGVVWKPIDIAPTYAVINVQPDSPGGASQVSITNNTDQLVHVFQPEVTNPAFSATLRTNVEGKSYQLNVAAVPPFRPGTATAQVTVRTTSSNLPLATVTAWLNVQHPLTIVPNTINLPAAPFPSPVSPVITVINNTTNSLAILNPKLSIPGVTFQVATNQPGKYITITLGFPAGYEVPQGQVAEFTAETGNRSQPVIKVPIYQPARQPIPAQSYNPLPAPPASVGTPPQATALRTVVPRATAAPVPAVPPAAPAIPAK